jgi:indole-3-glycerol phosphate synthase
MLTEPLPKLSAIRDILQRVKFQVAESKRLYSAHDLRAMAKDTPTLRSLRDALDGKFSLIAEIKQKSPSQGEMRHTDVRRIASIYNNSKFVRAVSVLTNKADFGMSVEALMQVKSIVHQPILRKDFIIDPHQVYEARAFGADAILLMASILTKDGLRILSNFAEDVGLEVLYEAHTRAEIAKFPKGAQICGINSRAFVGRLGSFKTSRLLSSFGKRFGLRTKDLSTDLHKFHLAEYFRKKCVRVAESGISPKSIKMVREDFGYDAVLVGTSILMAPDITGALREFEEAIEGTNLVNHPSSYVSPPLRLTGAVSSM